MSDLIPNLGDLREQLPMDNTSIDAHELLAAFEKDESLEDVMASVDALLDQWLEMEYGNDT